MTIAIYRHDATDLSKNKVHRGLAISKKTTTPNGRSRQQEKESNFKKNLRSPLEDMVEEKQQRSLVGSRSAPPFLVSKR